MSIRIHRALVNKSRRSAPGDPSREDDPISLRDIKTPWLLHVRRPKNRANAGAGMKANKFLKRADRLFPGGVK